MLCPLIRTSYPNLGARHIAELKRSSKKFKEGPSIFRESHEIFRQELPMIMPEELKGKTNAEIIFRILMQKPLEEDRSRISQGPVRDHARKPRGSHQELLKIFPQGREQDHAKASDSIARKFPQDLLITTCTRSCKDTWEDFPRISARSSHKILYKISFHIGSKGHNVGEKKQW